MTRSVLARRWLASLVVAWAAPALAANGETKAGQFGKLETVEQISLSPDGSQVVFIAPTAHNGNVALVAAIGDSKPAQPIMRATGDSNRLSWCRWASDSRIICSVALTQNDGIAWIQYDRLVSLAPDGSDMKTLTAPDRGNALRDRQDGGSVIDWLAGDANSLLITRQFVPEYSTGTHLAKQDAGLGVERVDPASLARRMIETAKRDAAVYITDGRGHVRVMGMAPSDNEGMLKGTLRYFFRRPEERGWSPLSVVDQMNDSGFTPYAVDAAQNVAYGFDKKDGRQALYRVGLENGTQRELVFARPDVDVDSLIRLGRERRVVGVSWATDRREIAYFDPELKSLATALSKALPDKPQIEFLDASSDERKLLIWAGSDVDPGRYYRFDKDTKQLQEVLLARPDLEKAPLAPMRPVTFAASDGTQIPAYLTLPPGSDGRNLPAIVMPHGGPSARDEWGFDWLAQFFAAQGYAVLQPNYRGSSGYGDAFFGENGFQGWKTAIGDIDDAGRWLQKQGIAAPGKLAIVGWSYGGYAALQSGVLDPGLFKAIVAVAPVTDLGLLKTEAQAFTNSRLVANFVGDGPHVREGSPAQNADKIVAPVLIFHGDRDLNVDVAQGRLMADKLKDAGKPVDLVIYPGLDHQLRDAQARTELLAKSDAFIRAAFAR